MNLDDLKRDAIDLVVTICLECGVKYRRSDFNRTETFYGKLPGGTFGHKDAHIEATMSGNVVIRVYFDENGKRGESLKKNKDKFIDYYSARVLSWGILFTFTKKELELEHIKKDDVSGEQLENIMDKIKKLFALAESDNEHEAIAASMKAQQLLAKYNIDISNVTGKEKVEDIAELTADVDIGNKWKYQLAEVVAASYCCKVYYVGSQSIVFRGYKSDILIARRVYLYLYSVCKRLGKKRETDEREAYGSAQGVYNSFCMGFVSGVGAELGKNCKALMLITPKEVEEDFSRYTEKFGNKNTDVEIMDFSSFDEGVVEGKRALNAQYLENKAQSEYTLGTWVEEDSLGALLTFDDITQEIGRLIILDMSTESHKWYKVVMVEKIHTYENGKRRLICFDGERQRMLIDELYFEAVETSHRQQKAYRIK